MVNKRILVVDDDMEIFQAFQTVLTADSLPIREQMQKLLKKQPPASDRRNQYQFELHYASQGQEGLRLIEKSLADNQPFALAFIDVRMPPGWDGVETATRIRAIDPDLEIVIVTAYSDRPQAEILDAVGSPSKLLFFKKPFDPDEVMQLAIALTEKWNITASERQATASLKASEERFRTLVEAINDWVWEIDVHGKFTYCSPISRIMLGYAPEDMLGRGYEMILPAEEHEIFQLYLQHCRKTKMKRMTMERRCIRKDGEKIQIESSFSIIANSAEEIVGFRGIDRDITARKLEAERRTRMEEQFRQVQKLEALGSLASGIAHDFNNILSPIIGYSQMCLLKCPKDDPTRTHLEYIELSANKATDLVRQILGFARKGKELHEVIDINQITKTFSRMLCRLIPENITLRVDLTDDIYPVQGDACQIEQVLINLVVNARDAMPFGQNGEIVMTTQNCTLSGDVKNVKGEPISGEYATLSVRDNGSGISPEHLEKIFDPFYTTKELGKGTGIGLATIANIVEQNHGHIRIETELGRGTTFHVYLQKSLGEEVGEKCIDKTDIAGGNETILLAEDDRSVRAVVASALNKYGYRVSEVSTGTDALKLFREQPDKFDLLITDIIMPGLGGRELVDAVREFRPQIPVILVSGYPLDILPEDLLKIPRSVFIQKPMPPSSLAQKTREVLDTMRNGRS